MLWGTLFPFIGLDLVATTSRLRFFTFLGFTTLPVSVPLNRWCQILIRINFTTSLVDLSLNGVPVTILVPFLPEPAIGQFVVGAFGFGQTNFFRGLIGRISVWHQYFSDLNVSLAYNGGLGRPAVVFSSLFNSWSLTNPTLSPDNGDVPGNGALTKSGLTADLGPFALLHYKSSDYGPALGSWNWNVALAAVNSPYTLKFRGRAAFP